MRPVRRGISSVSVNMKPYVPTPNVHALFIEWLWCGGVVWFRIGESCLDICLFDKNVDSIFEYREHDVTLHTFPCQRVHHSNCRFSKSFSCTHKAHLWFKSRDQMHFLWFPNHWMRHSHKTLTHCPMVTKAKISILKCSGSLC